MQVTATLRVVPQGGRGAAPSAERLYRVADELERLGFSVLQVSPFGILVETDDFNFEHKLGVRAPEKNTGFSAELHPHRDLAGLVDRVEISAPIRYYE